MLCRTNPTYRMGLYLLKTLEADSLHREEFQEMTTFADLRYTILIELC